jgi:phosphonate transport system substrate-binding protein
VSRRNFLSIAGALALGTVLPYHVARAQSRKLRCAVGPLLPSADDTRKAYTPIFAYLAKELGTPDLELAATTDWAGVAVAMGSGQVDVAWMGPWGYIIANSQTGCQAVATVKYDDKPIYHAIIIARPDLQVAKFPDSTKGLSMSFADVGSTSGWLIPTYYAKEVWKIDPRAFWKYSEGATHAANEVAVQAGQVDLATDFDRNRNAMIAAGRIKPEGTKVVWQSEPLPNDAIAVPQDAPADMGKRIQAILTALSPGAAKDLLPTRYTGFVPATHQSYQAIEAAGIAVGRIKPRS